MHPEVQKIVDDVHSRMMNEWSKKDLNTFFITPYADEGHLFEYHHGFGTWIRNEYGLWKDELWEKIDPSREMHPDDLSMIIIQEVWKKGYGEKS
jgi:hypothetical protein